MEPQKMFKKPLKHCLIIANYVVFWAAAARFGRNRMFVNYANREYNI